MSAGKCSQCGDELIERGMGDVCWGCGSTPDSCPCSRVPAGQIRNEPPEMGPHPADGAHRHDGVPAEPVTLPGIPDARALVVIRKAKASPRLYPRQAGAPRSSPL